MSFLLGAYGKLMAGKRVRELQARMMSVQSQLRRATRDVANMERDLNAQARNMKSMNQSMMSMTMMGMNAGSQASIFAQVKAQVGDLPLKTDGSVDYSKLTTEQSQAMSTLTQQMTTQNQYQMQAMQNALTQQNAMIENSMEAYKEAQLQPLKDLEEELETEKASLESQIQLAQADYDACKEMEKAGVKSITPNYTGQG